jgi:hypothetical protein
MATLRQFGCHSQSLPTQIARLITGKPMGPAGGFRARPNGLRCIGMIHCHFYVVMDRVKLCGDACPRGHQATNVAILCGQNCSMDSMELNGGIGVAGVRVLPISNDAALGARGNSSVDGGTPNCFTTMLEGGLV